MRRYRNWRNKYVWNSITGKRMSLYWIAVYKLCHSKVKFLRRIGWKIWSD